MPGKYVFEYAVIRIVPRVHREEFVNAGVILYCHQQRYLQTRCLSDLSRLSALDPECDIEEVRRHLDSICLISNGDSKAGVIAQMQLPERFRWLTAIRSTVVQTSRVHPGYCLDPAGELERLFNSLVG